MAGLTEQATTPERGVLGPVIVGYGTSVAGVNKCLRPLGGTAAAGDRAAAAQGND